MELPTYTSIWRIEKRLYKLYDFRLPMPLPVGQIAVFAAVTVPYIVLLTLFGLPFNHNLFWLYVLPPGLLTWLATRPVLESKRLPELIISQARYIGEPSTWCRMAPLAEKDEVVVFGRVWRRVSVAPPATAEQEGIEQREPARELPVPARAALPVATAATQGVSGQGVAEQSVAEQSVAEQSIRGRAGTGRRGRPARDRQAREASEEQQAAASTGGGDKGSRCGARRAREAGVYGAPRGPCAQASIPGPAGALRGRRHRDRERRDRVGGTGQDAQRRWPRTRAGQGAGPAADAAFAGTPGRPPCPCPGHRPHLRPPLVIRGAGGRPGGLGADRPVGEAGSGAGAKPAVGSAAGAGGEPARDAGPGDAQPRPGRLATSPERVRGRRLRG